MLGAVSWYGQKELSKKCPRELFEKMCADRESLNKVNIKLELPELSCDSKLVHHYPRWAVNQDSRRIVVHKLINLPLAPGHETKNDWINHTFAQIEQTVSLQFRVFVFIFVFLSPTKHTGVSLQREQV